MVNLGFLAVFVEIMGLHVNLSSAFAIEISIISNFVINELWTFRDRRKGGGNVWFRAIQFHVVSFLGGIIQWTVFVSLNVIWLWLLAESTEFSDYFSGASHWFDAYVLRPILDPPDVGSMKYISQLFGIGVATFWNFLVNFYWTWKQEDDGGSDA